MKGKKILIILLILIVVIAVVYLLVIKKGNGGAAKGPGTLSGTTGVMIDEVEEVDKDGKPTKTKKVEGSIFDRLNALLTEKAITYDRKKINALSMNATEGWEYALSDGTVIQLFRYNESSDFFKKVKRNNKIQIEGTDVNYEVQIVEDIAIYFKFMGDKAAELKETLV